MKRKSDFDESNPKGVKRCKKSSNGSNSFETPVNNRSKAANSTMDTIVNCDLRTHIACITREWTEKEKRNELKPSPQVPKRFELTNNLIKVGRDPNNCDLVLQSSRGKKIELMISRMHAKFQRKDNGYHLFDNGSTNGVFVNNKKLAKKNADYRLKNGDIILFGKQSENTEFYYKYLLLPKNNNKKSKGKKISSQSSSNASGGSSDMHLYDGPSLESKDDNDEEEEDIDVTQEVDSPQKKIPNNAKKKLQFAAFPSDDDEEESENTNTANKNKNKNKTKIKTKTKASNTCKDKTKSNDNNNDNNNNNNNNNGIDLETIQAAMAQKMAEQFSKQMAQQMEEQLSKQLATVKNELKTQLDAKNLELEKAQSLIREKEKKELLELKKESLLKEKKIT